MDKYSLMDTLLEMERNARKCAEAYHGDERTYSACVAEAKTLRLVVRMLSDPSFCDLIKKLFKAANRGIDTGDIESLADAGAAELTKAYTYANSL